jgi:L-threonylcarbamoyladenylate synthase
VTLPSATLRELVEQLAAGGVIACPTETFVGLLANACDAQAVARVCELKGRDPNQPIGVLLPDLAALASVVAHVPALARELALRHWPGPLTLVLPVRPGLPAALSKDGKIGVRVPGASPALDLVRAFGGALTATSANKSGEPAARTEQEARAAFPEGLAAFVPGDAPGGLPSTLVDVSGPEPIILRAGAIPRAAL